VLEQLNLTEKRFIVCYEEDWADIPLGGGRVACENGFMVSETYWDRHESNTYQAAFTYINIPEKNVNWTSYRDARDEYYAANQHIKD
jgi:hypothetical protein